MPLSKNALAAELERRGHGRRRQIANILDGLAEIAQEQVEAGEDFIVPGVAKIGWGHTAPRKKGEMYKKGETYIGFGGVEQVAEADSKPRARTVRLKASPAAPLKRIGPTKNNMSEFLKSRTGRAVVRRKG